MDLVQQENKTECDIMFYKCVECDSIFKTKPDICDSCNSDVFEELEKLNIDNVVCLIRDYEHREDTNNDVADYWDVWNYVEDYINEDVYSLFDEALKKAEEQNIAIKRELIFSRINRCVKYVKRRKEY